jgi:hypothetical protein
MTGTKTAAAKTGGIPAVSSALFIPPAPASGLTPPPDTRLRAQSGIEWIPASLITRDERVNTRPVDTDWVAAKAGEFNWDFLGLITVSRRPDGTIIPLDGQNRVALVAEVGQPDADLKCEVFENLTLAQEAALFLGLNAGRPVRPVSKFLARVTMGDPVAVAVQEIAAGCSWKISPVPGTGVLLCVNALTRLHAQDAGKCKGGEEPQALRDTLTVITKAWGHRQGTGHEAVISGVGKVMLRDGRIIRDDLTSGITGMDRLIESLRYFGDESSGLLSQARSFSESRQPKVGIVTAVADTLARGWNHNKRVRTLAPYAR